MTPSLLRRRVAPLLFQLAFLALALTLAQELAGRIRIVPSSMGKFTPFSGRELETVFLYFGIVHAAILLIPLGSERRADFLSLRRLVVEFVAALAAVSLASSCLFLLTQVPFAPNFYAWIYLLSCLGYGVAGGVGAVLRRKSTPPVEGGSEVGAAVRLLRSPALYVGALVILLPGLLAGLYKKSPDFANWVNSVRVSLNVRGGAFKLVRAFPGKTFDQPMFLAFSPVRRDEFFVLTRPGRLLRYQIDPWKEETLIDITAEVGSVQSELGALSFALHPDFGGAGTPNGGFIYVWYTHVHDGRQSCRLTRFDVRPATLPERNATHSLLMDLPRASTGMHNGGTTLFGPDGFLYISVGDHVVQACSQQVDRYLAGGILRIDVDQRGGKVSRPIERRPKGATTQNYFIPSDNPWVEHPGALEEFYAIGLRNPFRMWMDPLDRDLWLGDIGLDHYEEVNRVRKGDNAEWDFREGPMPGASPVPSALIGRRIAPVLSYRQTALDRAVIGGMIHRGRRLPALQGHYVFCDNNSGKVMSFDPKTPEATLKTLAVAPQYGQMGPTGLFQGPGDEILVTVLGSKTKATGEILRLAEAGEAGFDPGKEVAAKTPSVAEVVRYKFEMVCARCHGVDGRGLPEFSVGENLTPRPDFTLSEWQARVTDDHIKKVVVEGGKAAGLKSNDMPSWTGFFEAGELDELVRLIRGFGGAGRKDAPRDSK